MTAEIAQAYNDREEEESEDKPAKVPVEKLYELANEIVPYCMRHNGMSVHTLAVIQCHICRLAIARFCILYRY